MKKKILKYFYMLEIMQSNLDRYPELGYLKNCNACRLYNFAKEAGINSTFL